MALRRLGLVALAVAIAATMGCARTAADTLDMKEPRYTPNDVPIATLFYVGHGFQQAYPYGGGGRGTTGWNAYGPPGTAEPFPWTGFTTTWPEIGW